MNWTFEGMEGCQNKYGFCGSVGDLDSALYVAPIEKLELPHTHTLLFLDCGDKEGEA